MILMNPDFVPGTGIRKVVFRRKVGAPGGDSKADFSPTYDHRLTHQKSTRNRFPGARNLPVRLASL
jgi:hypothetical protein